VIDRRIPLPWKAVSSEWRLVKPQTGFVLLLVLVLVLEILPEPRTSTRTRRRTMA
jgi:hypothetical protein